MKTKLEHKVLGQDAYASTILLSVDFEVKGDKYYARAIYLNGGYGLEDIEVLDSDYCEEYDDEIRELAEELLMELDITKNLNW